MKTDLLFALRSLRRAPAFFGLAVATLGLGIAANTAIFSLFYQVLLRSLPVHEPERLVVFHSDPPNLPNGRTSNDSNETVFSYVLYKEMRESRSLQGLAARSSTAVQMIVDGVAERGHAEIVSGNFFDVLGIRARIGRLMNSADDSVRGGNPVTVLAHEFWRRRFGGSASVLNRTIQINGQPFSVIGVAPEGFRGVIAGDSRDVFVPISMRAALNPDWDRYERPSWQWLTILGRLAPGVTREQALAELRPRFAAVIRSHVDQLNIRNQATRQRLLAKRMELRPASQGLNTLEQAWRQPLFVLLAMVLLLLVIGCANLVNLLMARAINRAREISIRLALGAGRARVLRLLLTESALLALIGTLCGLLLTPVLTRGILRLLPEGELGGWLSGEINLPILGFSMLLMLIATLLFGLLPALQATRRGSALGERQSSSGGQVHSRSRKVLVAGQIALSLVLLCTAGLFGRSLANLMQHKPGFRADHLLSFAVDAGLGGYNGERGVGLYRELERQLAAIPGVESVSFADTAPLSHSESSSNVSVEGYPQKDDDEMNCDHLNVASGFFHTLGTAMLEGREFDERDRTGAPKVAVVNQAFVKRFLANRSAVGRKMAIGAGGPLDIEIVGVAADINNLKIREASKPTFFVPFDKSTQPKAAVQRGAFFVRSKIAFDALSGSIRTTMAKFDATLPVFALQPMQVNIDESIYTDRLIAALSTAFGLLALLLTAVGLYGVIAYLVSRRTAEIGIRMVLGASPRTVLSMILGEVGVLVVIGGAAGVLGAIGAGRAIASELYAMPGIDPVVLVLSVVVLSCVALGAACVPAIRAARVQPLDALRHD
jgi:predicted permease